MNYEQKYKEALERARLLKLANPDDEAIQTFVKDSFPELRESEAEPEVDKEKELTAQEIVEKLIDEQKISGKEAEILLNAINKPAEIKIEPYTPPITTPWSQLLNTREPKCYEPGGICTNPHKDCINCPAL